MLCPAADQVGDGNTADLPILAGGSWSSDQLGGLHVFLRMSDLSLFHEVGRNLIVALLQDLEDASVLLTKLKNARIPWEQYGK